LIMNKVFKRLLDISISLPAIVLLSPVFVVIAIAIKLNSRGPVVFKQERAGKNGRPKNIAYQTN